MPLSAPAVSATTAPAVPASTEASTPETGRAETQLRLEAAKARGFGKHMVAAVFDSLARTLPSSRQMRALLECWPGDLAGAGAIFRLNAGLHALARSGSDCALQQIYAAAEQGIFPLPPVLDRALMQALQDHEATLLRWMAGPTQTNEVARMAGLVATLLDLDATGPMPCEVLELGASAGLNLGFMRYGFRLGRTLCGDCASPVQIAPRWRGPDPAAGAPRVVRAEGVDLSPLDVASHDDVERLQAYIWAGERERSARLSAAVALARKARPRVSAGRAGNWLARELAQPQREGLRRVVFHSMVVQYMPATERAAVDAAMALAGAAATAGRPLVRVGLEWREDRSAVELRVTVWDGSAGAGRMVVAAQCHPYAEWFDWYGLAG